MKVLETLKAKINKVKEKLETIKNENLEFKKNYNYLSRPDWLANKRTFHANSMDYSLIVMASEYYNKLCKDARIISKIRRSIIYSRQAKLLSEIESVKYISKTALFEFAKFYYGARSVYPSNNIHASFSHRPYSFDEPHFILRIKTKTDIIVPTEICIRDRATDKSLIEISTTKQINPDREVASTVARLFLDQTENDAYKKAWMEICNYMGNLFEIEVG